MKLFVWDLHGTLEMGNEKAVTELSNKALAAHGFTKRFTTADTKSMYGVKWRDYYKLLLPNESADTWLELYKTGLKIAESDTSWLKKIKLTDHAAEVLGKIAKQHKQILISNTTAKHLWMYVEALGLDNFFKRSQVLSAVTSIDDPTTKPEILQRYLKGKKYDMVIAIGDRSTDMEMAHSVGGIGYLYAHPGWEFHPAESDYKIHDLRRVLREI